MSLETEIKKLTAALIENTNALATNEKGTIAPVEEPAQASPPVASAPPTIPADVLDDAPALVATAAPIVATLVAAPTGEVIDKKQIIAAFIDLGKAKGREIAVQFLATRGVSKASGFNDPTQYAEILAALTAATEAK